MKLFKGALIVGEMTKILITGGCGFIGSHVVNHILTTTNWDIIIVDKLTYASQGLDRMTTIGAVNNPRVVILTCDLTLPLPTGARSVIGTNLDYILHMCAETHVDSSVSNPGQTCINNIACTINILEFARTLPALKKLLHFSTDEVYGPADDDKAFKETERHNPTNPYAASKSAAEQIANSYLHSYNIPLLTMNVMNVIGERQHPEKFIPLCVEKLQAGDEIKIHTDNESRIGTRFYIYAKDVARAILLLLDRGIVGETYNLPGVEEVDNFTIASTIYEILKEKMTIPKPIFNVTSSDNNRPNIDRRYSLDGTKILELGFVHEYTFHDALLAAIFQV